ncbi:MAG: hypothetical protein Greene041619_612 [Candidatus Peregrinibacteria bacterium Greene0416_19]|nr:MAG: hypothetical protein Greene041619_612 [Candidatus Peregrinibacteria bacterium Greene0416_19]
MRMDRAPGKAATESIRLVQSGCNLVIDDPALSERIIKRFGHIQGTIRLQLGRLTSLVFPTNTGLPLPVAVRTLTVRIEGGCVLCTGAEHDGGPVGFPALKPAMPEDTLREEAAMQDTGPMQAVAAQKEQKNRTAPGPELALRAAIIERAYAEPWAQALAMMVLKKINRWNDQKKVPAQLTQLAGLPGEPICLTLFTAIARESARDPIQAAHQRCLLRFCQELAQRKGPLQAWALVVVREMNERLQESKRAAAAGHTPAAAGKELTIGRVRELLRSGKGPGAQQGLELLGQLLRNPKRLAQVASRSPGDRLFLSEIGQTIRVASSPQKERSGLEKHMGESQRLEVRAVWKATQGMEQREVKTLLTDIDHVSRKSEEIAKSRGP